MIFLSTCTVQWKYIKLHSIYKYSWWEARDSSLRHISYNCKFPYKLIQLKTTCAIVHCMSFCSDTLNLLQTFVETLAGSKMCSTNVLRGEKTWSSLISFIAMFGGFQLKIWSIVFLSRLMQAHNRDTAYPYGISISATTDGQWQMELKREADRQKRPSKCHNQSSLWKGEMLIEKDK